MNFNFPTLTLDFFRATSPIFILSIGAIIALLQGVYRRVGSVSAVFAVTIATLLLALVAAANGVPGAETSYLAGSYLSGALSGFGQLLILVIASVITLLFRDHHLRDRFFRGEIASLFLMIVTGMLVMASSDEMVTLFIGLELASIGLYAIIGYINPNRRSQEGAIKYFVLGSFAAGLLLYGFALIYAATGSMRFSEIVGLLPKLADHNWLKLGLIFAIAGLGFKLAMVPFHNWAPDAYEAAPTGVTAFMATSVKVMILIVTMRLLAEGSNVYEAWMPAMMLLAVLSMIGGNIMALVQSSLKRMLAYSSIAHSGYMAIAICALSGQTGADFPAASILYYLVGYAVMSLGAFAVLMWLESDENDNLLLDDLAGLAKKHPWASFALATFMFGFSGFPPTVGFMSKFFVFGAALQNQLYGLVIVGVIGSSISLYYYLRVVVRMYFNEPVKVVAAVAPTRSFIFSGLLAAALLLTVLLGTVMAGPAMKTLMAASQEVSTASH